MRRDEIRKLLGGYATDNLTESERRCLFEAALDDQELFNALEDEQALKALLANAPSREAIHRALARPVERKHFWRRSGWLRAGIASAAAATVLIVAVVEVKKPVENAAPVEIASTRAPEKSVVEPRAVLPEAEVRRDAPVRAPNPREENRPKLRADISRENTSPAEADRLAPAPAPAAVPAAAPPPPPAVKSEQAAADTEAKPMAGLPGSVIGGGAPASVGSFALAKKPPQPLRYSLLKRDSQGVYSPAPPQAELRAGDSVRLSVSSGVGGYLSLYEMAAAGDWKRIFPESGDGLPVAANSDYTIPEAAIEVQNGGQRFRISLNVEGTGERAAGAKRQAVRAAAQSAAVAVPLNVEFTIAPGKVP